MINDLAIVFFAVMVDAFPYMMIGIMVSNCVSLFVDDSWLVKLVPKNKILGSLVGVLFGFFVPGCGCATIPLAKKLIKKGVNSSVVVTFMLSSPITNPVVLITSYFILGNFIWFLVLRTIIGVLVSIIIGLFFDNKDIILDKEINCDCCLSEFKNIKTFFSRCYDDIIVMLKYLIVGSLIVAIIQMYISSDLLFNVSKNSILEIIIMMTFSFIITVCSISNAYMAKSFVGVFSNVSILGFLIIGPIISIKNTILSLSNFKSSFVFKMIFLVFIFVFVTLTILGVIM